MKNQKRPTQKEIKRNLKINDSKNNPIMFKWGSMRLTNTCFHFELMKGGKTYLFKKDCGKWIAEGTIPKKELISIRLITLPKS